MQRDYSVNSECSEYSILHWLKAIKWLSLQALIYFLNDLRLNSSLTLKMQFTKYFISLQAINLAYLCDSSKIRAQSVSRTDSNASLTFSLLTQRSFMTDSCWWSKTNNFLILGFSTSDDTNALLIIRLARSLNYLFLII